jgi:hypothetical protein
MESVLTFLSGSVVAIVFSAFARALPQPVPLGSRWYLFFYAFIQNLLANFDKGREADKVEAANLVVDAEAAKVKTAKVVAEVKADTAKDVAAAEVK